MSIAGLAYGTDGGGLLAARLTPFEFYRQNLVFFEIDQFDTDVPDRKPLSFFVESLSLPSLGVNVRELFWGNQPHRVAGAPAQRDPISMTLVDFFSIAQDSDYYWQGQLAAKVHTLDALSLILDWHALVYDRMTGNFGYPRDYFRNATIHWLQHQGYGNPEVDFSAPEVRSLPLYDVFPSRIEMGEADMNSDGEPIRLTVTLEYSEMGELITG